jgi:hypothetical protein
MSGDLKNEIDLAATTPDQRHIPGEDEVTEGDKMEKKCNIAHPTSHLVNHYIDTHEIAPCERHMHTHGKAAVRGGA